MGVKGLWTLLEPSGRPVRLETLAGKRLAVDASIWLYQLFKAMRDDDGNPLEEAHILGFYRRISKLLFYDIRPVFVFDGAAPELKKATVAERQARREERTRDAKHAAQQLLQTRLKLQALEGVDGSAEEAVGGDSTGREHHTPSPAKKRKRDEYELPPMENEALATRLGNRDDMRMAHPDDLRQLLALVTKNAGSISNLDEIAIDTDSAAFKALSAEDQHDLIVALKVRSRQTSHNRLQAMLESSNTSMDFSKQQISNLVKRNNLTQQWLEVTGAGHRVTALAPGQVTSGRVASERNREYTLIKSSQPGGGWTLKMSGGGAAKEEIEEGTPSNEIMISSDEEDVDAEYDSDAFEDVDIENEQPRFHAPEAPAADQIGYSSHLHQPHQPHQPQNIVLRQPGPDGTNATSYANTQPTGASVAPAHLQPHGLGSAHPTHIVQDAVPVSGNAAEYPDVQQMAATGPSPMASSFDDLAIESDGSSALASNDLDYGNYESNSEAAGSDIEANANLLALYGDYGQLEELHRKREEEIRQQREREEYTIVAMSVQDFLNIWMNLATPAMLDADPFIRVNMQRWLLEERLDSLRMMAHKASRQFEKQPELDLEEPELDGAVLDVDAYEEVQQLRVRVSTLALLSNYLSYAVKWREAREMPAQQPQVHQVVEPEAISDTGSPEVIALESSSLLAGSDLPRGMTQFADEPEAAHDEQRKRDLVFAKAELFAQDSADILPQTKKHRATDITVHNIDSDNDSEDDVDGSVAIVEQQASDADIGKSECKASEDSAIALDAKSAEHDDDDDDEAAMDQQQAELMRNEQDEYARFVDKLKRSIDPEQQAKRSSYEGMRAELENELQSLRARVRDSRRDASTMDSDMVEDVRMLLTMFGVPYVTAPMEAEAQCARLVELGLVDGMVTDDSDAFLFAPTDTTRVYRNFFQKDKFVELYTGSNVFRDTSLSRRDFVFMACLLGSDYTVGIKGIGPVLAMEALAEFGPSVGSEHAVVVEDEDAVVGALTRFREWCDAVRGVLPGASIPEELVATALHRRLARVVRNSEMPARFPDPRVVHAYFTPLVDESKTRFEWGTPNMELMRGFLADKLGWDEDKTNETLVPLLRTIMGHRNAQDSETPGPRQATLDAYTRNTHSNVSQRPNQELASIMRSKRIDKVISSRKRQGLNN